MFGVIKKILAIIFLLSNANSLKCVLTKDQECKIREVIINNEYMLYPFSVMEIAIISVIHFPECVFQMLLKILIQKCLI